MLQSDESTEMMSLWSLLKYWKKYQWRENVRQSNFEQEWKKNYPFESYLDLYSVFLVKRKFHMVIKEIMIFSNIVTLAIYKSFVKIRSNSFIYFIQHIYSLLASKLWDGTVVGAHWQKTYSSTQFALFNITSNDSFLTGL